MERELAEIQSEQSAIKLTRRAYQTTQKVLSGLDAIMHESMPFGDVMDDSDGGLRIEWGFGSRTVRLAISAATGGPEYLYYEENGFHGTEPLNSKALAGWLYWLMAGVE